MYLSVAGRQAGKSPWDGAVNPDSMESTACCWVLHGCPTWGLLILSSANMKYCDAYHNYDNGPQLLVTQRQISSVCASE
ncbi:hypothetical protein PUN4_140003 [Paraburkholderia unamae]|nr:hypothetical protein PUN4_140003 [Paraburkholderia unamae]